MARFVIHAAPIGKARPRVTSHGTFTPKKTKDYEELVRLEYMRQCKEYYANVPLRVTINAHFPIPKSKTKAVKRDMAAGAIRPTVKPDADNLAKAILDALKGLAYNDDSQIVSLYVEKWYSEEPHTEVYIQEAI